MSSSPSVSGSTLSPHPVVSTGRGGQGNIGPDPTEYTDGGIFNKGAVGASDKEEYSTGRGGAGNIGSPEPVETDAARAARYKEGPVEVIPEVSKIVAPHEDEGYHIGRGGGGNFRRVASPAIHDNARHQTKSPKADPGRTGSPAERHSGESFGARILEHIGLHTSGCGQPEEK